MKHTTERQKAKNMFLLTRTTRLLAEGYFYAPLCTSLTLFYPWEKYCTNAPTTRSDEWFLNSQAIANNAVPIVFKYILIWDLRIFAVFERQGSFKVSSGQFVWRRRKQKQDKRHYHAGGKLSMIAEPVITHRPPACCSKFILQCCYVCLVWRYLLF